jgi:hypothetical protein
VLKGLQHAGLHPLSESAPARHPADCENLPREPLPRQAWPEDKEDAAQAVPVVTPGPSALGSRRMRGQEGSHPAPQGVGHKLSAHTHRVGTYLSYAKGYERCS